MSEGNQQSKINESNLNVLRLNTSWIVCKGFRSEGSFDKWKWELDSIWSDLIQDVKSVKEPEKIKEENERLKKEIAECNTNNQIYFALDNRHNFLRELQDLVGKGSSSQDSTEKGFKY